MKRRVLLLAAALTALPCFAGNTPVEQAQIDSVRLHWRARTGETPDQIAAAASKLAHFHPRGWKLLHDYAGNKFVCLSWTSNADDAADEERCITWAIRAGKAPELDEDYGKVMELGSKAFALAMIFSDGEDGATSRNKKFAHNARNLNFVKTPQGALGDLLERGKCSLEDPVSVDYAIPSEKAAGYYYVRISVDCKIKGPAYFTHSGEIMFQGHQDGSWEPATFFAKRISGSPPGHWFEGSYPEEDKVFSLLPWDIRSD